MRLAKASPSRIGLGNGLQLNAEGGQFLADVPELLHRAKLNLANALTSHIQRQANFLESPRPSVVEAEPQANDVALSRGQAPENRFDFLALDDVFRDLHRSRHVLVRDEVAQRRIVLLA